MKGKRTEEFWAQYITMKKKLENINQYKEIYAMVKNPTIAETIRLNRLRWFGHVQRMEENRIPPPKKSIVYEFGNNKAEK